MLTREAWNALLKILEEPPPRVIFVFATTEPQKIEQTAAPILSRCQRFDFRRIGVSDIVARLRDVLDIEGVKASDEALRLVAKKAEGGMRDGLSVLEQVLAFAEGELTADSVRGILGVVGDEHFLRLFGLIADRDRGGIFDLVEELVDGGYDLVEFYHGLGDALRTLLRHRVAARDSELPESDRKTWEAIAGRFEPGRLVQMLRLASELETEGSLRRVGQPRVLLELLLLRFTYLENTADLESLLAALGGEAADPAPSIVRDVPSVPEARSAPDGLESSSGQVPADTPAQPVAPERAAEAEPEVDLDLRRVWGRLLDEGKGLPRGMRPLLRAVEVSAEGRSLQLQVPPGPLLERLREGEMRALERAMAEVAGVSVSVSLAGTEPPSEGDSDRISSERVEKDRLTDLLDKEPGLRPAVEELDLELME